MAPETRNINMPGGAGLDQGHGHVFPRPDGSRARCGGPRICGLCARDLARKNSDAVPIGKRELLIEVMTFLQWTVRFDEDGRPDLDMMESNPVEVVDLYLAEKG